MTSIGNDYGFEQVYARQVSAWGQDGDVLVAISTSGVSPNVLAAVHEAKKKNMTVIGLTGNKPSSLRELSDLALAVPSADTPQIQQAHITIFHAICDLVEQELARKGAN
jgi:D-sedoheptulose 7-phosphate isomerase